MAFELPPLPYAATALQPHVSEQTLNFHHGKHHRTYVDTLNKLTQDSPKAKLSLEALIMEVAKDAKQAALFNNAGQHWNHSFFWRCMKPQGGGKPSGSVAAAIDQSFGDLDRFKQQFKEAAVTQFGSGWAWLVLDAGTLKVVKTGNADTPLTKGLVPLLTIDVWEHAYYIDYQNKRDAYVNAVLDKIVNWGFAAENL
jgi:superoxide dismutase, Fe-Mn family